MERGERGINELPPVKSRVLFFFHPFQFLPAIFA